MLLAAFCGLVIRGVLVTTGQSWARTYSNTATYILLPVVGLVITSVISSNIALSLGMIGALSIVRFRHPVKSPIELSIYFLLVTVGVALQAMPLKGIALVGVSAIILFMIALGYSKISHKSFGTYVAEEYLQLKHMLEVESSAPVAYIEASDKLVFSESDLNNNKYLYKLAYATSSELMMDASLIKKDQGIAKIRTTSL